MLKGWPRRNIVDEQEPVGAANFTGFVAGGQPPGISPGRVDSWPILLDLKQVHTIIDESLFSVPVVTNIELVNFLDERGI
jgi:hypothetical protein